MAAKKAEYLTFTNRADATCFLLLAWLHPYETDLYNAANNTVYSELPRPLRVKVLTALGKLPPATKRAMELRYRRLPPVDAVKRSERVRFTSNDDALCFLLNAEMLKGHKPGEARLVSPKVVAVTMTRQRRDSLLDIVTRLTVNTRGAMADAYRQLHGARKSSKR